MAVVNKQAFMKNAIRGKFLLLLSGLFILTISWKKESNANLPAPADTIKRDSTILLAALKTNRANPILLTNTAPTEITAPEGQLRAKAQLQAYMDTLMISPAATIGLKRDAKAVIDNNTVNGHGGKPVNLNRTVNDNSFVIDNTSKLRKILPPDLPSDPDF